MVAAMNSDCEREPFRERSHRLKTSSKSSSTTPPCFRTATRRSRSSTSPSTSVSNAWNVRHSVCATSRPAASWASTNIAKRTSAGNAANRRILSTHATSNSVSRATKACRRACKAVILCCGSGLNILVNKSYPCGGRSGRAFCWRRRWIAFASHTAFLASSSAVTLTPPNAVTTSPPHKPSIKCSPVTQRKNMQPRAQTSAGWP